MATGTLFISHLALPGEQSVAGGEFVNLTLAKLTDSTFPNARAAWRIVWSRSDDGDFHLLPQQSAR